ncbi:MAG: SAM-dependent chlorinase/fluorinase [Sulfuricellaceae bacterium]|nr:SAM-dependent chlorinase/fluorinase [Sulfuricellaceae bacterium]
MIQIFSDFGAQDIYVGQIKSAIMLHSQNCTVLDLFHESPPFSPIPAAHLLAALSNRFDVGSVCLAVVDPGVGSTRAGLVMLADDVWYVGPDNGLLSVVAARARKVELWRIQWAPEKCADSFHGRDIFGPIAAWIDKGEFPHGKLIDTASMDIQLGDRDLSELIYIDHYGNAMTGMREDLVSGAHVLNVDGHNVTKARVFSDVTRGELFWYVNSIGLVEIAANMSSAAQLLNLQVGMPVTFTS